MIVRRPNAVRAWLRAGVIGVLVVATASRLEAYSAVVSVEALFEEAHTVVVGEVVSVQESGVAPERGRVATVRVLETWKGPVRSEVQYTVSPGWFLCDTSDARKGEKVVLFLTKDRIAHFGRGRMPIGAIGGTEVAFIHEVTFPASLPVRRQQAYPMREGVSLGLLRSFIQKHAAGRL